LVIRPRPRHAAAVDTRRSGPRRALASEPPGLLGGFSSPHRCKPTPFRKHGTDWDETSIPDVGGRWIRSYDQFQPQHENFRQHGSLLPSFLLTARNGACLTIVHLARAVNQPEVLRRDDLVLGLQYRCASASSPRHRNPARFARPACSLRARPARKGKSGRALLRSARDRGRPIIYVKQSSLCRGTGHIGLTILEL
jgi:hypothetical protein